MFKEHTDTVASSWTVIQTSAARVTTCTKSLSNPFYSMQQSLPAHPCCNKCQRSAISPTSLQVKLALLVQTVVELPKPVQVIFECPNKRNLRVRGSAPSVCFFIVCSGERGRRAIRCDYTVTSTPLGDNSHTAVILE